MWFQSVHYKNLSGKKVKIYFLNFYLVKSSENIILLVAFYLIMWLMELSKTFEKIVNLKADFQVSKLTSVRNKLN